MNELIAITPEKIGIFIWLTWAAVGVAGAFVAHYCTGRRTFLFDLIIGVVAALLGGFLTTGFIGGGPVQLFLLSVLGAIFFAAAALWITGALIAHFRKDEGV